VLETLDNPGSFQKNKINVLAHEGAYLYTMHDISFFLMYDIHTIANLNQFEIKFMLVNDNNVLIIILWNKFFC